MPHYDFRTPRVYLDAPLAEGQAVSFDRAQANYLLNVLRLKHGDALLLFNGRDGEWQAGLAARRADRPGGRLRRGGAGLAAPAAECGTDRARAAHPARRYRGGGGARA